MKLLASNEKSMVSMADERTPLIQHVDVRPHRDRYPHHRLRFFCTTLLSATILIGGIAAIVIFSITPSSHEELSNESSWSLVSTSQTPNGWLQKAEVGYEELQRILLSTPDAEQAREWSKYYTSGPHLAGKNLSQALWTKERWEEFGVASTIVDYDVYINYPKSHRLALLENKTTKEENLRDMAASRNDWEVKYEATLEEDVLKEDKSSQLKDRIPTFHGYSASGNVTAPYVFVNYGTYQDFEDLRAANISLEGKIALAKYGGVFRGLKVKRAQELGMVGVVMYSDPGDDGDITEKNGNATYPDGPARNPSSVQRGSVQFLSFAPGDPTTPGYPSKPGCPRQPVDHAIPHIPSLPISYLDALPLLKALNGHGPKASSFQTAWHGAGLDYKGVHYNIGPSPDDIVLNLINEQEYVTTPLWNVVGIINGTIPDEVVVLGNHRDAWIAGGAGDPNSGSAAFNEVIRSFGFAAQAGWKPMRTIVFASWDGEEYGLVGSTEWVEEYLPWLSAATVAYLNVDVGANGPNFRLSAAPLLTKVVEDTLRIIPSPNQTIPGQSVYSAWDKHVTTMGSGSDFTAFQDFAGIPSVDMGFGFGSESAVYHYHSNYDSFDWMERFGDTDFEHHATIAKVWGLVAAKLVETPVLQLNATEYAIGVQKYVNAVKVRAQVAGFSTGEKKRKFWASLDDAVAHFTFASLIHDGTAEQLLDDYYHADIPWWQPWRKVQLYLAIRAINTKYKLLERQFLYPEGLDGRPWFKHVVFAPGKWTGYAGATFPGIVEGIDDNDEEAVEKWVDIAARVIDGAAEFLEA
ncbi:N-acetylated-alpha-linked acidic dipeptidase-like protein [Plenodomus tracheiphilus IPT5]|uniref:N-acetylated-alpha-linked acidic dipeptidase-like protein n=1 Tax=Plenodomus tracheiphilus IPT5 TaxID=1408161 RepID=A0A6A7B082_9PLEO|nr:N-acetylated-alpha-linked acidic dipeptidase-like protein [Plenodomus tracheiphilus IPT5]